VGDRSVAVRDQHHVELHELVALACGETRHAGPGRHPVAVTDDAEVGHRAGRVDSRSEADVGGEDVVGRAQQPARVGEAFAAVQLQIVVELTEEPVGAIGVEARLDAAEDVELGQRLGGRRGGLVGKGRLRVVGRVGWSG
jgi:hypothetical protein